MKYYSAFKKDEILPFAITWMELEGIMLSEVSQSEEDNYMVSLMWNLRNKTGSQEKGGKKKIRQNQRGRQTIKGSKS